MRKYLVLPVLACAFCCSRWERPPLRCRCWWQHLLRRNELPGPKAPVHRGSRRERPEVRPNLHQPGQPLLGNRRGNHDRVDLPGIPDSIRNGKFSFALNDPSDRFSWSGTITPTKASGKESIDVAAFDNKGDLPVAARVRSHGRPSSGSGILGDRRSSRIVRRKGHQGIERHGALLDHPLMASLLGEGGLTGRSTLGTERVQAPVAPLASLVRCAAGMIE